MVRTEASVGATLRSLRHQTNLGIKSVGPLVGVSYSYLSKIENDIKRPSIGLISRLCELYGVDADHVIAMSNELPPDIRNIIHIHGKEAYDLLRSTYNEKD